VKDTLHDCFFYKYNCKLNRNANVLNNVSPFNKGAPEYKVKQFPKCFVNSKNKSNFAAQKIASK